MKLRRREKAAKSGNKNDVWHNKFVLINLRSRICNFPCSTLTKMPFISRFLLVSHFRAAIAGGNRSEMASIRVLRSERLGSVWRWQRDVIDQQPVSARFVKNLRTAANTNIIFNKYQRFPRFVELLLLLHSFVLRSSGNGTEQSGVNWPLSTNHGTNSHQQSVVSLRHLCIHAERRFSESYFREDPFVVPANFHLLFHSIC